MVKGGCECGMASGFVAVGSPEDQSGVGVRVWNVRRGKARRAIGCEWRRDGSGRSGPNLRLGFIRLRRAFGPQALLLAPQPHRGPVTLQAFSGAKLAEATLFAG
jgi:hypothetical protein